MDLINQITSPDLFTRLSKALLSAEYKDFQTIDDSGGDAGNDGYSEKEQVLFQIYCPEKPEKADASDYKSKVKNDLDKAKKLIDSGKYKIKDWIFITPRELTEPVQTYIRTEATSRGMNGIAWAGTKLTDLFAKHCHLRSQFPDLIMPDVEKQIQESTAQVIDRIESADEVRKEYKTKREQEYQRRIDQAKEKLDQGKYETAKKEYELILGDLNLNTEKIDPHINFRVFNNLGVCELNLGNPDKAAELFDKAYKAEPNLPMAICKLALSKLLKGDAEGGLSVVEELLKKHPNDDQAISTKANILNGLQKYDDLIAFLKQKGKTVLVHWFEGLKKTLEKDYDGAVVSFENVVRAEPKNIKALLYVAQNIMVGMRDVVRDNPLPSDRIPDEIKKKFERAIECLNQAVQFLKDIEQKDDLEMAYANLSGCFVAIGQYEKSIASADQASAINPNSDIPFLNKGVAQLKLNRYQDSIKSLQTYKDLGGTDIDVDRHIAFCALRIGDLPRAEKIITELLENESGLNLDIAELAIDLYSRKLDNEKLNPLLKRLEEGFPNNSQALRIRASYMQRVGMSGARDLLQRALESSVSESEKVITEIELADLLYDQKEFASAAEIYKKYLKIGQSDLTISRYAQCLYNSGQFGTLLDWTNTLETKSRENPTIEQIEAHTNLYLGNLDRASQQYKNLFEKNPNNFQHLVNYGMCRFRLGRENDAKVAFDAVKSRAEETRDLVILASGYEFIGEWDTAIELTFKALENDPNNPKAHLAFIFTFLKREQADGKEPDQKHIKAFQKSMAEFNKRFPEEKALQGFEVKDNDISQILKMVDQAAEVIDNATNLYKESQAPLATVPKLAGKRPFDVWAAFTQMPAVGIKISFGSPDEVKNEALIIEEYKNRSIVVDIYPLFLLAHLDQLDLLSKIFKKIYVHQSVMDELTEIIDDRKISAKKGVSMLGKIDGNHRMTEISPEQVKKTLNLLEKIRNFISSNPGIEVRGLTKEKEKGTEQRDILDILEESTRDSVLLAKELEFPLYCDDRILRAFIGQEYKIKSFSSQTLFVVAQKNNHISLDQRHEFQKTMIDFNYEFISIDAVFIFNQLKKANYEIDGIQKVISNLAKKETNIESLGVVFADFLLLLTLDRYVASLTKLNTYREILKQVGTNHNLANLEEGVFANLQSRTKQEKHDELKNIIRLYFQI
ncbi:MAG: tetratricopeptide repeat protein [Candidatus Pacebacteria bacterium]|nr:tetratricopeptide repeat protein [Candidatus Paceibacterota bacterium]